MRKKNRKLLIQELDITEAETAQQVWQIQIPAYEAEAELIKCWDLPPLKETAACLQQCGETFYGGFIDGQLAGAISFKITDDALDIHRLMVARHFFRQGVARALIGYVEQLAAGQKEIIVATGTDNLPAVELYKQQGFKEVKKVVTPENLSLTFFSKEKKKP